MGGGGGGGGWRVECRNIKSPSIISVSSFEKKRLWKHKRTFPHRPPTRKEVHSEDALDHASKPDIAPYFREHLKIGNKLPLHSRRGKLFCGCGLFKEDLKQKGVTSSVDRNGIKSTTTAK